VRGASCFFAVLNINSDFEAFRSQIRVWEREMRALEDTFIQIISRFEGLFKNSYFNVKCHMGGGVIKVPQDVSGIIWMALNDVKLTKTF